MRLNYPKFTAVTQHTASFENFHESSETLSLLHMQNSQFFGSLRRPALTLFVGALISSSLMIPSSHAATAKPKPTASAKPSIGGTRPSIAGGQQGQGGPADEGSAADVARHAAMKKYQDCLTASGVTLPDFGGFGRGGFGGNGGARPTGAPTARPTNFPTARPSLTAEQQAALDKCAPLRPAFGRGGPGGGDGQPGGVNQAAGTVLKKNGTTPSMKPSAKVAAPAKGAQSNVAAKTASAAYIACLNKAGVNVKTAADITSLDKQSPKIASALKTCSGKK